MVFKNFRLNIIIRILLLTISIFALGFLLHRTGMYFSMILFAVFAVLQVISLIHYVEKSNRDVTRFLDSIRYSDFSQSFSSRGLGSSFNTLNNAFGKVISEFRKIRQEKEEH